jgi:ElaB/YqjD/DUF883 family membrane-anchored ribosome-binding protein
MEDRIRHGTTATEHSAGEWARSEARDLAESARQGVTEAKGGAKEYAAEAKEYAQGAMQHTKEYVEGAREYIEDSVQQARDKISAYREGGMDKVKHDVMGYTREQPMTALLIAVGAGMVLGWLSAVGRR